jgi:ATP-binding cassette subfamily B protein
VLSDLSLAIPAGANVAFVGPSGSGKSTTVSLLMRFWDPQEGSVRFDGHDARDVTAASLRDQTGVIFQDTFVFNTTLRENIALGRPEATDAEVAAAARAARLEEYIGALPAGYDTIVGERGVRMSGGQRQRLAIARALVRDPRILILDEATSALDAGTEHEIQETLTAVSQGRTTIAITHRLASAATADVIFVLDRGRLVEQGTHAELVAAGGLYARLYGEQSGRPSSREARRAAVEVGLVAAVPLFATLDRDVQRAVAERLVLERRGPGEEVVRQGDLGDRLYAVGEGQLDVLVDGQLVGTLHKGDFFGELALLSEAPRSATVRTLGPTELYSLSREDFLVLMEHEPAVRAAVLATAQQRVERDAARAPA